MLSGDPLPRRVLIWCHSMGNASIHTSAGGVVSAGDIQTARAGALALEAGGNAVDAVVAAGFAAFVCEVALCGPLGGGVMVGHLPERGEFAVDFFGRTPDSADPNQRTSNSGKHLSISGLPVRVSKWWGRSPDLPLPVCWSHENGVNYLLVAEPAVLLGRNGFEVGAPMAYILELISTIFAYTPESKALCLTEDGRLPQAGERLFNAPLGDILESIAARPAALKDLLGAFAEEFGPAKGGLVTERDIREMSVSYLSPVKVPMRDWTMSTMPAPSSGGCLIALGLRLLEGIGDRAAFMSPEHLVEVALTQRLLLEVRAADFDEKIHDPAFVAGLLSDERIEHLRTCLGRTAEVHPDNPLGSTTQISVIDGAGGVIGMTLTNGEGWPGSSGNGHSDNNLLGEADINPRGFHVDPPGTHMATMMAPTIARQANGNVVALGSGGSNRLRNAIMMTLCNLVEYGVAPQEAVLAPRLHVEATQAGFELNFEDADQAPGVLEALQEIFPATTIFPGRNMFRRRSPAFRLNDTLFGVGDPRRGESIVVPTA